MSTVSVESLRSEISSSEEAVLYPTFGHRGPAGRGWKVGVWGNRVSNVAEGTETENAIAASPRPHESSPRVAEFRTIPTS